MTEKNTIKIVTESKISGRKTFQQDLEWHCYIILQQPIISWYLVLGTADKSELMLGYFTKFGDAGADIFPIGELYKSQAKLLARQLKLPISLFFSW